MNISREFAITNLETIRKNTSEWIKLLKEPELPEGTSVNNVPNLPVEQLRAELLAMAGILESLCQGT
jgi:hypothetical protein